MCLAVEIPNGESPAYDEKVTVTLPPASRLQDAVLYLEVVHANAAKGVKPFVGSTRIPLRDVVNDVGVGGKGLRNLRLKRPSGRPHGKMDVKVAVREPSRYYESGAPGDARLRRDTQALVVPMGPHGTPTAPLVAATAARRLVGTVPQLGATGPLTWRRLLQGTRRTVPRSRFRQGTALFLMMISSCEVDG